MRAKNSVIEKVRNFPSNIHSLLKNAFPRITRGIFKLYSLKGYKKPNFFNTADFDFAAFVPGASAF